MSIPGVDGCLTDFTPSAEGVLVALPNFPVFGLTMGGEGIICCACVIAFGGSTGGGSVDCDRWDDAAFGVKLVELFLFDFLAEVSERGGVSCTGDSCGDRSELISILRFSCRLRVLIAASLSVKQYC